MDTPAIDVWMQHPNEGFIQHDMFASLRRWNRAHLTPELVKMAADPTTTISSMDAANIEKGIICAWYGPDGAMISNEDVLGVKQLHPDRFECLCSVDLRRPTDAVREIRKYVGEHGFIGVRVLPWLWELPPDHRLYYPIYQACVDLGVPFCLQVGLTGPLKPSGPGNPVHIERVALDFPDLTIVCGHVGAPFEGLMISLARKFENIYIDTSAYVPKRFPPALVEYMRNDGDKKVLFGSNYPMLSHSQCRRGVEKLGMSDESLRKYFRENACRVFNITKPASL